MRDLVSFVVFIADDQNSSVPNSLENILLHGVKLFKVPVDGVTCTYLSRRNTFKPIKESDSLWKVCEALATVGTHRVPVVNDQGEVVNIVSQSTIITFLDKHISKSLKEEFSHTIEELHIGGAPVISVTNDTPAVKTFRLMDNKKISGVAVVDETGRLVGNTSGSDLKLFLKTPSMELLDMPIMNFLNKIRQESLNERSPTISCSSKDSLRMIVGKLASTKIHRMFIANDSAGYKPEKVISISYILKLIVKS